MGAVVLRSRAHTLISSIIGYQMLYMYVADTHCIEVSYREEG